MTFTILGGDARSVYLTRRLIADGHRVRCFGLDTANIPLHCRCPCLSEALSGTDCVLLPIPAMEGAYLRAPYGSRTVSAETLAGALPVQIPVFAGSPSPLLADLCSERGICLIDLLSYEPLTITNAALTADAALRLLQSQLPCTLAGQQVLILGAGRIGKLLGIKLQTAGAQVTVTARKEDDKAWCAALGLSYGDTLCPAPLLPVCDILINTIPARVLGLPELSLLRPDTLLLELASGSGGFDPADAEALGLTVLQGRGLPGRFLPQSAADAIADTIYYFIRKR